MNDLDQQSKEWFCDKVSRSPEYVRERYLPALDANIAKAQVALHEAERKGTFEEIKYSIGRLDGAQEALRLISGLRMSDSEAKQSPSAMSRTLDYIRRLTEPSHR